MQRRHLIRRRRIGNQQVQQGDGAKILHSGADHEREHASGTHRILQAADDLIIREGAFVEIFHYQRIAGFRRGLDDRLAQFRGTG